MVGGYTDKNSYFPGEEVEIFLQANYDLDCKLGFYDINDRMIFSAHVLLHPQDISTNEPSTNGYNYKLSAKVKLPLSIVSGVYLAEKKIPIIVKSSTPSDITVVYPVNTMNAYNQSGGKSLYSYNSTGNKPANIVSFFRPMPYTKEQDMCYGCLSFLPSLNGIRIRYITDIDLDDYASILQTKILMIIGHSEYWTRKARNHFDQFVNAGGHAIILSGNTMWWQVRYSEKKDALVCYKSAELDLESDPLLKTISWNDSTLKYSILSSIGADFEHGGFGTDLDNGWDGFKIVNPTSPLLEGLKFNKGDILYLPSVECDGAPIKGIDDDGFPILDNDKLKFEKVELIGFDRGSLNGKETFPTFIVMQKTKTSGVIVNTGTNSWCSPTGIGRANSGNKIRAITQNTIVKLLNGTRVFSN